MIFINMKSLIKQLLRESLVNEIRVINPNFSYNKGKFTSMEDEPPLHDNETIRVYHGFNKFEDAIMAAKFGLSGEEKARRIYSYESNNNPNGLFVTLDYETAKKFTYPSGDRGIKVVMELSVKVADLEQALRAHYAGSQWVTVESATENGKLDAVALKNTNKLELRVYGSDEFGHAVVIARLDNLGKGASGAAVQNLELMLGQSI